MSGKTPHNGPSRLSSASERDRHLMADGRPKRILSLDGGGVRGMVTIGILSQIEKRLAARAADPAAFRLCHYFDLIGGTSTGSIIAALLAMGWSVEEITRLYLDLAPRVFGKSQALGIRKPKFSHAELEAIIRTHTEGMTLDSERLKTGFALFAKRIDTGSAWVMFNHPDSKYWEPGPNDEPFRPNRLYEVGGLVRASAAAPYFFDAAEILVAEERPGAFDQEKGIFLDGAVGGVNNPSVQLLTLATLKDYPFQWATGAERLYMISIGTGTRRERRVPKAYRKLLSATKAVAALQSMIYDTVQYAITTMQALSTPPAGSTIGRWTINGEIGNMPSAPITEPVCTFLRLDASLEPTPAGELLQGEFTTRRGKVKAKRLKKAVDGLPLIDNGKSDNLERLLKLGVAAGERLTDADFPAGFDIAPR